MLKLLVIVALIFTAAAVSVYAVEVQPVPLQISVNSNNDLTNWVWEGRSWSDPGATCTFDYTTWEVNATTPLDTSTPGSQTLTYVCKLFELEETKGYRTVQIHDDKPPDITLTYTEYKVYDQEASASYLGASCTDDIDGNLPLTVNGSVISESESNVERIVSTKYIFECTDSYNQSAVEEGIVTEYWSLDEGDV